MEEKMTKKDIFTTVENVKKALEGDKHFIYVEIFDKVYDVRRLEITGIGSNGAINVYDKRADSHFWFHFNKLITKADAENEKRKSFKEIYIGI